MKAQQTIAKEITLDGNGLFGGQPVSMTMKPAPANHGVVFVRTDLGGAEIAALVSNVVKRPRRTALRSGEASVEVTEHCLSAVAAAGVDNLRIEIDAIELPAMDGSSLPFYEAIMEAGVVGQDVGRRMLKVYEPIVVRQGEATIAALPADEGESHLTYQLDYANVPIIGAQVSTFEMHGENYGELIAPARTFVLEHEAQLMRSQGIGSHLSEDEVLVIGNEGPLGTNEFRFTDEPVRHKMLDLIGDLFLTGAQIEGRIVAHKSGHALNQLMAKRLLEQYRANEHRQIALKNTAMDIRQINRMLPHRYPMLMVDRILEMDSDRRVVGVKNVTINEPFFQGHFPGTPMMPGVLIVEALAQLSGVLVGQSLEHAGKLAVLLSLDRVKIRRPVTPGDQLILEAEAVKIRARVAHMRCRAYVSEDLAAEAELKFMLVDDDQD
ncbi:UDP-3-O-[3-hydroxymyristoyl] N-acetylglucosamine deacetylase [Poriferisphaera corsica]|uniref:Multifunctional fusion protein n=1 Tax=Poriferisphaera corsica TaxID=2528020 RepID=A0A517YPM8_9BACT|nr:UDP-3-O-acyl-N-acetylglucosamine deacetylase [Poriferisphaera corsica]QDU32176.1 UDP-3-O-[3-hydroxymyristoyl] N-acetylglucosamine deacetylase [Poriferisphaera corsica]